MHPRRQDGATFAQGKPRLCILCGIIAYMVRRLREGWDVFVCPSPGTVTNMENFMSLCATDR